MANYPDYRVVGDDDGRWYVIDGQCVVHDNPFHSRQSAIDYRDEVALRLEASLDRAAKQPQSTDDDGIVIEPREDSDSYCPNSEDHLHDWPRVEEHERCLCTYCGADGDA